ncbi:MAG: M20 family metallopeptidase [Candidatus Binatia bacterium]
MTSGVAVPVQRRPLTAAQQSAIDRAWAAIDAPELARLVRDMVSIPSPPGRERQLAEFMTEWMRGAGLDASYQAVDERQGNAVGRLRGSGGGPELLVWGELDTCLGIPAEQRLGMGDTSRPELRPEATVRDGYVVGLGAENPKGLAACAAVAVAAIARTKVPLRGDIVLGMPGGGMPTSAWDPTNPRQNVAHGAGCDFMLQQGVTPDFAIAPKPVYAVSWEEAGLNWFRVTVKGNFGYSGTRHIIPHDNAIVNAAKVIEGIEEWLPEYARRSQKGIVAPQGIIGAIEGGCSYKPAFYPDVCHLYLDIRSNPDTRPMEVKRQLDEALAAICARHRGLAVDCEMTLAIPGSRTDPQNWIVQSCMRAWEFVEQRPHVYDAFHSGATDVNVLRARGVPVARLGFPPLDLPAGTQGDLATWMGTVRVENMIKLVKCLIYALVETCTSSIEEVGLAR